MSQLDLVQSSRIIAAIVTILFSLVLSSRLLRSRKVIMSVGTAGSKALLRTSLKLEALRLLIAIGWLVLSIYNYTTPSAGATPRQLELRIYGGLLALAIQLGMLFASVVSSGERWDILEGTRVAAIDTVTGTRSWMERYTPWLLQNAVVPPKAAVVGRFRLRVSLTRLLSRKPRTKRTR